MSLRRRGALGSLILVSTCTAIVGQSPAHVVGTSNAAAPAALNDVLDGIITRYSINQAWFYLQKDNGETVKYTNGHGPRVSQPLRIASLSKSVTAIGIALLIQDGRLTLHTRLADVLPRYLQAKGHQLDPSLARLDIEHIMAHRGGLRTNVFGDPKAGISTRRMLEKLPLDAHFSDYLLMSGADNADGTSEYRYSNLSYVILGMVIEAVSGQGYEAFCQSRIFGPLRISGRVSPDLRRVAPFGGWEMSEPDLLRLWTVFDVDHPSLLTRSTLAATLLSRALPPAEAASNVYYTLGTYVQQGADRTSYAIYHDGTMDFLRGQPTVYSHEEKRVPGCAWIFVFQTLQSISGDERRSILTEVRAAVMTQEGIR